MRFRSPIMDASRQIYQSRVSHVDKYAAAHQWNVGAAKAFGAGRELLEVDVGRALDAFEVDVEKGKATGAVRQRNV